MTKQTVQLLFLQIAALVAVFGFASPRLKSAAALLQDLALNHWDELWGIINGSTNPGVKAKFAALQSFTKSVQPDDPYSFVENLATKP